MSAKSPHDELGQYGAEIVEPYSSLIENFRAFGYSLPDALADIVDNSIAAAAANVWIDFKYEEAASYITIRDDGDGMSKDELKEAMRPGTQNPLAERHSRDLGRFGLGLKSASFSQCRRVTVISKRKDSETYYRAWDLDYIEQCRKWQLLNYLSSPALAEGLAKAPKGTIVFWEKLDRIIYGHNNRLLPMEKFLELIRESEKHLAMVFHRYIEKGKLRLFVNKRMVAAWDPFLRDEEATQSMPEEIYNDDSIVLRGYVLPYGSKISQEKYDRAAGPGGWTAQQGFYIYRKERMLVTGDWLGIMRKTESTRLARIMVDIDSKLDYAWQLDIRKSKAVPPGFFREEMKRYGLAVRKVATEVYNHRGQIIKRNIVGTSGFTFAWNIEEINGRQFYKINRQHPQVLELSENTSVPKKQLKDLFLLLESTLPVSAIFANESVNNDKSGEPEFPLAENDVSEMMKGVYLRLKNQNKTEDEILEELYLIDPFGNYPHLIEALRNKP